VSVTGLQHVFEPRLFLGQLVKICIGFCVGGIDFIETRLCLGDFAEAFFDIAPDVLGGIELGFLWQETDLDAGLRRASPSNSVSSPAIIRSSVDFPAPFRPSTPILAPGKKLSDMSRSMKRLGGTILATLFMV